MNISKKGDYFITSWETIALRAYLDACGIPTIGIGRIKNVHLGDICTMEQACIWFAAELATEYEPGILDIIKRPLSQQQFDGVGSLTYNIGLGALRNSTLARLVNIGDYESAGRAFAAWDKAIVGGKLVALPGLTARRAAEADIFNAGVYRLHDGTNDASAQPTLLMSGSRGEAVTDLQKLLRDNGYAWLMADGDFGPETVKAVRDFQIRRNLVSDGVVGGTTLSALHRNIDK